MQFKLSSKKSAAREPCPATADAGLAPTQEQDCKYSSAFGNYHYAGSPLQMRAAKLDQGQYPQLQHQAQSGNRDGLPGNLKTGIELLSGMNMDRVKVHYNSSKPAQLRSLAFARGREIHLGPGQEPHLPHEAWHLVQQAQGRVRPTRQINNGISLNDDATLEREASVMGNQALAAGRDAPEAQAELTPQVTGTAALQRMDAGPSQAMPVQRVADFPEFVLENAAAMNGLREAYLQDVTVAGTWGAEVEARLLAQANQVRVVFWAENNGRFELVQEYGAGARTLNILHRGDHFEAIKDQPVAGQIFSRENVVENEGGGDCLYRAFFQALNRTSDEPGQQVVAFYRYQVAHGLRQEPDLDLEGMLVQFLDEYQDGGYVLGAGPNLNRKLGELYRQYQAGLQVHPVGGGLIPPSGRHVTPNLNTGMRDYVPRNELSRAERMIDRIGRLLSTKASVHVAVALDGNALVMSANRDTPSIQAAIAQMVRYYGQNDLTASADPLTGVVADSEKRVQDATNHGQLVGKKRRAVDIEKMKALQSGKLERLTDGATKAKLVKIKAALAAGLLTNSAGTTARQKYERGDAGIYLIPHFNDGSSKTVHGEMNVTEAIQDNRAGKRLSDDVYVGGTLIDCRDCNAAHGARNERLAMAGEAWRFYSGGTHGNSFPNWYLSGAMVAKLDQAKFAALRFSGRIEEDQRNYNEPYWDQRSQGQYGYDSGRTRPQYYFMRQGQPIDTPYSHSRWGKANPFYLIPIYDWFANPRSRVLSEDLFLRNKKRHIHNAHSSFAEDSDSDGEDYDDAISGKEKALAAYKKRSTDSYRSRYLMPEFSFIPSSAPTPKKPSIPSATIPRSLFASPMLSPFLSSMQSSASGLGMSSPGVGAMVPYRGPQTQNRAPGFHISPEFLRRMAGMEMGGGAAWQSRFHGAYPSRGSMMSGLAAGYGMRREIPRLTGGQQADQGGGQMMRLQRANPRYLRKFRRVMEGLFIQPLQGGNQLARLGLGDQVQPDLQPDLRLGRQQGAAGISMAAIFDQFMILLDFAGAAHITLSGSLNHCLQQVMLALHSNTSAGVVSRAQMEAVARACSSLLLVFAATGLGQSSLNDWLNMVEQADTE